MKKQKLTLDKFTVSSLNNKAMSEINGKCCYMPSYNLVCDVEEDEGGGPIK